MTANYRMGVNLSVITAGKLQPCQYVIAPLRRFGNDDFAELRQDEEQVVGNGEGTSYDVSVEKDVVPVFPTNTRKPAASLVRRSIQQTVP